MKYLIFTVLTFFILSCGTTKQTQNSPEKSSLLKTQYKFPEDWLGTYTGYLEAYRAGDDKNLYPSDVELTIAETSDHNKWQWSSVYHMEGRDPIEKAYFIIHPDSLGTNQYIMDEDNGIFINQHMYGNTMTGAYTVNEQFFTFAYTKIKDELLYELTVYNQKPTETIEIQEGFEVGKIEMTTVQRIYFRKKQD